MNKWTELFAGLVILVGGILVAWDSSEYSWAVPFLGYDLDFLHAAWLFFKGGLWWFAMMIGLLFILLGISDLKG